MKLTQIKEWDKARFTVVNPTPEWNAEEMEKLACEADRRQRDVEAWLSRVPEEQQWLVEQLIDAHEYYGRRIRDICQGKGHLYEMMELMHSAEIISS